MNALWLGSEDEFTNPTNGHSNKFASSRSVPFLGIFTDDPAMIARRLPRPKTPFVPAPIDLAQFGTQTLESEVATENFTDSPPAVYTMTFDNPRMSSAFGVSIF
jgi:hypothetical protein